MAWTSGTTSLAAQIESYLLNIVDAHTRSTALAWVRAWDTVAPDLEAALNELVLQAVDGRVRRKDVIRSVRLQKALDQIHGALGDVVDGSAAEMIQRLGSVVDHAGAMQERIIASQLPAGERQMVTGWSRVDARQVEAIVTRTADQITKLSYPISDEATASIRRELVRGVAVGDNPRAVASRMVSRTEGVFNGGLARANVIARTEMISAHREAARLSDLQNTDVLKGWAWTCAFSTRTCAACISMHGREFPVEAPGPDGHPSCRCARVGLTKSWSDLGFEGIEEPPSLIPSAADYFEGLPPADQRAILGGRGYDAWQAGGFPMEDWATKRNNPGWRDSWVPAKAPAA